MKPSSFSHQDREHFIQALSINQFDLLIIGGGITGAGVARDAASRGLKVALVEAQDFAAGTSSRSSKLIHGGIRYLENFEFHLVFEALSERQLLFEIAPHLVHPLRFLIPLYKQGRVGMLKMGLGMWLYDALSLFSAPELHARWSQSEIQSEYPLLQQQNLLGAYSYSDAYMDDDRLAIETLRSAVNMGAVAVNFVRAQAPVWQGERIVAVQMQDVLNKKTFSIRAQHVISTVGPWTDRLGQQWLPKWHSILRPSKGVHLTFRRERLPLNSAVVMAAEKRIVFAIPRAEMVIVGTTDTDFTQDPNLVATQEEDVRYILEVIERYFPGAGIQRDDIVASYAGVRPLVDDGSTSESKTSREHTIFTDPCGITFVAGGKYTTYRRMAEQAVDHILEHWSWDVRVRLGSSQTQVPLNPRVTPESLHLAHQQVSRWASEFAVPVEVCRKLVERHGFEAEGILSTHLPGLSRAISPTELLWSLELKHAMQHTMCLRLLDFYLRRSALFLAEPDHGLGLLKPLLNLMGEQLMWSVNERRQQLELLQQHFRQELNWQAQAKLQQSLDAIKGADA